MRPVVILVVLLSCPPLFYFVDRSDQGWDFLNVYAFHHCEARNAPYAAGADCDARGWPMNYPPLLYWSFAWTRLVAFPLAYAVWASVIAVGIVWAALVWGAHWFAVGLLLLFPSGFAIASGNNDVWVLVLWTLSWLAWRRAAFTWAGVLVGAAVAYKLYPVFALALVATVVIRREPLARRPFLIGVSLALVSQAVIFAESWSAYVLGNLQRYIRILPEAAWHTHAMPGFAAAWLGDARWGVLISAALFVLWGWALLGAKDPDRRWLFAGALALSTYVVTTSYDYNLLTTYPLLATLWLMSRGRAQPWTLCLLAGLVAIGHRNVFLWVGRGQLWPAMLQILWLAAVPFVLRRVLRADESGIDWKHQTRDT